MSRANMFPVKTKGSYTNLSLFVSGFKHQNKITSLKPYNNSIMFKQCSMEWDESFQLWLRNNSHDFQPDRGIHAIITNKENENNLAIALKCRLSIMLRIKYGQAGFFFFIGLLCAKFMMHIGGKIYQSSHLCLNQCYKLRKNLFYPNSYSFTGYSMVLLL